MILHWVYIFVQIYSQVDLVDWLHLFLEVELVCLEFKRGFWRCWLINEILLGLFWFYRDFCFSIKLFNLLLTISVAIYDIEDTHADNYHYENSEHDKNQSKSSLNIKLRLIKFCLSGLLFRFYDDLLLRFYLFYLCFILKL